MPLQQTSGNVTQDAYGGGKAVVPTYVENVFSTYLYTGTGATQNINNGIAESTSGALTWIKTRSAGSYSNVLFDTVQGAGNYLISNNTYGQNYLGAAPDSLSSFNSNGFSLGADTQLGYVNLTGNTYASWTFRKQPKFFDIQTWTGTGSAMTISHNLQSVPGCIIVKRTDSLSQWYTYHQSLNGGVNPEQYYVNLCATSPQAGPGATLWNGTPPTSTVFSVNGAETLSGATYVAYVFASNAGGFGLTGTQDIISCGSLSTNSSGAFSVNLGWEPQFLIVKRTDSTGGWFIADTMRGWNYTNGFTLYANDSSAEQDGFIGIMTPNATGFACTGGFGASRTYIYIAIRRGPMATPTTGTSVFSPNTGTPSTPNIVTTGFPVDMVWADSNGAANGPYDLDRLRGDSTTNGNYLLQYRTNAETNNSSYGIGFDSNTYIADNFTYNVEGYSGTQTYWNFARAPGFFDEVCYTGTGTAGLTINHNLGVVPQLIIFKCRSNVASWLVSEPFTGADNFMYLNTNDSMGDAGGAVLGNGSSYISPTSSIVTLANNSGNNGVSGRTYVAYLFASCPGVSKVGTYTGNGTGQSIACGFGASGARFVLIKRTDSTGNWYVFDSANGLTSSSSPYFILNTASTPTTGNNGVYASSGGFTLGSTASTTTNISSASYIFLAVS